ncbi:unnamed protein product [marine sediment metagenome]|uniref:Uncharacterized protein n=1 Tax=marine sediment metagenome TaxID=412755 RepID=X1NPE7_9ZZZZ
MVTQLPFDFQLSDLTQDGNWYNMDLTALVPAGATQVKFQLTYRTANIADRFMMREKGNFNTWNIASLRPHAPNQYRDYIFLVTPNADRFVQYRFVGTDCNFLRMTVCGWWP